MLLLLCAVHFWSSRLLLVAGVGREETRVHAPQLGNVAAYNHLDMRHVRHNAPRREVSPPQTRLRLNNQKGAGGRGAISLTYYIYIYIL